jgi:hypothetical protein
MYQYEQRSEHLLSENMHVGFCSQTASLRISEQLPTHDDRRVSQ